MKRSSLSDWLQYQQSLNREEIDLSLDRVKKIFEKLNLEFPDKNTFLIAGTNGKGTTLALIEDLLILRGLRTQAFDVLIGINLLREGLDLPEVSMVAVLDADKEGFLRSKSSLLQVSGRAARNVNG